MDSEMSTIEERITAARAQVRKTAKAVPHIYPEYNAWCSAKQALKAAKEAERQAKGAWDRASCKGQS